MPVGPRRRLLRRRMAFMLLTLLTLATACTVGPSDRPPVAVRDADLPPRQQDPATPSGTPAPPPLGSYVPNSLPWRECTADMADKLGQPPPGQVECSVLLVNADVSTPVLGDFLQLDITRVGSGPAPLVVLGEAAGEPGTVRAVRLAAALPPQVLDTFSLIGVARRGTGPSEPLNCVPVPTRNSIVGVDPDAARSGQLNALLDVTRTAIQTCVQDLGEILTSIHSTGAADDLEALRVTLQAPVLHILAHGEASRTVTDYLRRYPRSVGRVVLDGAADPTLDGIAAAEAAITATEAGFNAFAADCVAKGCALAPDPRGALLALTESLRRQPQRAGGQLITAGMPYQAVLEAIGEPRRWPDLADALAAAQRGDSSALAALVAPVISPTRGMPARFDPALATHCNDTATRVPPERAEQLADQWRDRSPMFGPLFAQRLLLCSAWPVPSERPATPVPPNLPPVLVVATAGDPVTPLDGARRTADSFPSGTLLTWQGQAHGAVGRSGCVTDLVTAFLVRGEVPQQGTLCPP